MTRTPEAQDEEHAMAQARAAHSLALDQYKAPEQQAEGTLVIMKPDALERNLHWVLLRRVEERCGLKVAVLSLVYLSGHDVYCLYGHQEHQDFWVDMLIYLTSGPAIVAIFTGEDAIEKVRAEVGHYDKSKSHYVYPGGHSAIRTAHGDPSTPNYVNLIHASSGLSEYGKERRWLIGKIKEIA